MINPEDIVTKRQAYIDQVTNRIASWFCSQLDSEIIKSDLPPHSFEVEDSESIHPWAVNEVKTEVLKKFQDNGWNSGGWTIELSTSEKAANKLEYGVNVPTIEYVFCLKLTHSNHHPYR